MDRPSPPRETRRPRELSFYKKTAREPRRDRDDRASAMTTGSTGSFSTRRDPLDRMSGAGRDRGDTEREKSPPRRRRRETGDDELERRRGEYRGGAPLERVPTRDDRRDRGEPWDRDGARDRDRGVDRNRSDGRPGYRGGDDLRRVETRNEPRPEKRAPPPPPPQSFAPMIEVIANDRLGRKVRVKCSPTDTVGDLKKLIAAQTGTNASKIQLKKWYTVFKDHIELRDYEIHDGMSLEMY
ncbi:hypothetical protein NliqN6_6279 [Naganishia liquefaciens]|uniref:Ubiquitin-like modifier HUB1 n=1 Tax=Naganishia liquefaciens TaxID=104408 RepID=A0A8H3YJ71_9TREE|nr:hypothetical protein NliqN6_6279 [Naganishia liquefaciens]